MSENIGSKIKGEISRSDLFHPKIAEPRAIWLFPHNIVGAIAMFAVEQSPYPVPDNLEAVLMAAHEQCVGFDEMGMRKFESVKEVEIFIRSALRGIPQYRQWNERKNGDARSLSFISRYDVAGDPDDDFIDLGALERNVALHLAQQAALL